MAQDMPPVAFARVACALPVPDLLRCRGVCRSWREHLSLGVLTAPLSVHILGESLLLSPSLASLRSAQAFPDLQALHASSPTLTACEPNCMLCAAAKVSSISHVPGIHASLHEGQLLGSSTETEAVAVVGAGGVQQAGQLAAAAAVVGGPAAAAAGVGQPAATATGVGQPAAAAAGEGQPAAAAAGAGQAAAATAGAGQPATAAAGAGQLDQVSAVAAAPHTVSHSLRHLTLQPHAPHTPLMCPHVISLITSHFPALHSVHLGPAPPAPSNTRPPAHPALTPTSPADTARSWVEAVSHLDSLTALACGFPATNITLNLPAIPAHTIATHPDTVPSRVTMLRTHLAAALQQAQQTATALQPGTGNSAAAAAAGGLGTRAVDVGTASPVLRPTAVPVAAVVLSSTPLLQTLTVHEQLDLSDPWLSSALSALTLLTALHMPVFLPAAQHLSALATLTRLTDLTLHFGTEWWMNAGDLTALTPLTGLRRLDLQVDYGLAGDELEDELHHETQERDDWSVMLRALPSLDALTLRLRHAHPAPALQALQRHTAGHTLREVTLHLHEPIQPGLQLLPSCSLITCLHLGAAGPHGVQLTPCNLEQLACMTALRELHLAATLVPGGDTWPSARQVDDNLVALWQRLWCGRALPARKGLDGGSASWPGNPLMYLAALRELHTLVVHIGDPLTCPDGLAGEGHPGSQDSDRDGDTDGDHGDSDGDGSGEEGRPESGYSGQGGPHLGAGRGSLGGCAGNAGRLERVLVGFPGVRQWVITGTPSQGPVRGSCHPTSTSPPSQHPTAGGGSLHPTSGLSPILNQELYLSEQQAERGSGGQRSAARMGTMAVHCCGLSDGVVALWLATITCLEQLSLSGCGHLSSGTDGGAGAADAVGGLIAGGRMGKAAADGVGGLNAGGRMVRAADGDGDGNRGASRDGGAGADAGGGLNAGGRAAADGDGNGGASGEGGGAALDVLGRHRWLKSLHLGLVGPRDAVQGAGSTRVAGSAGADDAVYAAGSAQAETMHAAEPAGVEATTHAQGSAGVQAAPQAWVNSQMGPGSGTGVGEGAGLGTGLGALVGLGAAASTPMAIELTRAGRQVTGGQPARAGRHGGQLPEPGLMGASFEYLSTPLWRSLATPGAASSSAAFAGGGTADVKAVQAIRQYITLSPSHVPAHLHTLELHDVRFSRDWECDLATAHLPRLSHLTLCNTQPMRPALPLPTAATPAPSHGGPSLPAAASTGPSLPAAASSGTSLPVAASSGGPAAPMLVAGGMVGATTAGAAGAGATAAAAAAVATGGAGGPAAAGGGAAPGQLAPAGTDKTLAPNQPVEAVPPGPQWTVPPTCLTNWHLRHVVGRQHMLSHLTLCDRLAAEDGQWVEHPSSGKLRARGVAELGRLRHLNHLDLQVGHRMGWPAQESLATTLTQLTALRGLTLGATNLYTETYAMLQALSQLTALHVEPSYQLQHEEALGVVQRMREALPLCQVQMRGT